ncbi:hypothetical protein ACFSKU_20775 [Pontibacter silvestris]|uniref:Uncharacterized protein n=1 Tax=Pontibacter silvestris TaxID=2305183 RepID=A0ABW4X5M8_9BACT|nr:hypothetical protein [Pontibacter silvestris]MCC9137138.1 hypothetical protein [Pontibacter silvestris]
MPYLFVLALGVASLVIDIAKFNNRNAGRLHESLFDNEAELDTTDMWRAY